jgi:hypothetical protein
VKPYDARSTGMQQAVLDLWERERAVPSADAKRRVADVQIVAFDGDVAVSVYSAYLSFEPQLRTQMWHSRSFVAAEHRRSYLAAHVGVAGFELLSRRYDSGGDRRAPGILHVIENTGMGDNPDFARPVLPKSAITYIGQTDRGFQLRVEYFPGAVVPLPS